MKSDQFIPYTALQFSEEEMLQRSKDFYAFIDKRRSVRDFSDKPVPKAIVENIIMAAAAAP